MHATIITTHGHAHSTVVGLTRTRTVLVSLTQISRSARCWIWSTVEGNWVVSLVACGSTTTAVCGISEILLSSTTILAVNSPNLFSNTDFSWVMTSYFPTAVWTYHWLLVMKWKLHCLVFPGLHLFFGCQKFWLEFISNLPYQTYMSAGFRIQLWNYLRS
jgi:hypothetical protein